MGWAAASVSGAGHVSQRSGGSQGSEGQLALCLPGLCQPAKRRLCIWPRGTWGELEQELLCQPERFCGAQGHERLGRGCICGRGGKGSLHLLEGDDGAGWGGLNAHKAGVQGHKASFQQRTAVHGTLGLQESCTGLKCYFSSVPMDL